MEFHFNFTKDTISKNVEDFLIENLKEEADHIKRVISGRKLDYKDANQVLKKILTSLYSSFGENKDNTEGEIVIIEKDEEDTSNQKITEPKQGSSKDAIAEDKARETKDKTKICRFYGNGACKFKQDCRYEHPKMCNKFTKNGQLKKNNQFGCDGKCEKFHPNVCRDSLKNKECPRELCRFYHLKGTKLSSHKQEEPKSENAPNNKSTAPVENSKEKDSDKVFRSTQLEILNAIRKLGVRMDKLEDHKKSARKSHSQRRDWRKSEEEEEEDW